MMEQYTSMEQAMNINRFTGIAVDEHGTKRWYRHGHLHREDGPAKVSRTESCWFQRGILHRSDGPAVERADGLCLWYHYGMKM